MHDYPYLSYIACSKKFCLWFSVKQYLHLSCLKTFQSSELWNAFHFFQNLSHRSNKIKSKVPIWGKVPNLPFYIKTISCNWFKFNVDSNEASRSRLLLLFFFNKTKFIRTNVGISQNILSLIKDTWRQVSLLKKWCSHITYIKTKLYPFLNFQSNLKNLKSFFNQNPPRKDTRSKNEKKKIL